MKIANPAVRRTLSWLAALALLLATLLAALPLPASAASAEPAPDTSTASSSSSSSSSSSTASTRQPTPKITLTNLSGGENQISLSDERDFQAVVEVNADVEADDIVWTLSRAKGAQDETLFPYQYLGGPLGDWTQWDSTTPYFARVKTEAGPAADSTEASPKTALTLTFSTRYFFLDSEGKGLRRVDTPRATRNAILDVSGEYTLAATLASTGATLGAATVKVSPYDEYQTMAEIEQDIRLAVSEARGVDGLYVTRQTMGKSADGITMPYVVISDSKASVDNYLALTQEALADPDAVLARVQSGELKDYRVPVLYSNIHPDENPGADAPMAFIWDVIDAAKGDGKIAYDVVTGFTDAGRRELAAELEDEGIQWSELIKGSVTGLGFLKGTNATSGVVDLERYYTVERYTLDVHELLDDVIFIVCPSENVDGRTHNTRQNGNGFDLNRDNLFQTQPETVNMTQVIAKWNPATLIELHGFVSDFQIEPCSPPHEPNFEYDLFAANGLKGGEAFGVAAVANNALFNSYVMPLRDYLVTDEDGEPYWQYPWDDMSTNYTPQYSMLHGTVAYTIEVPEANSEATAALEYGLINHADYVARNKKSFYVNQLTVWSRGVHNVDDPAISQWYVDMNDNAGAEADVFRPKYEGNGNFFPEYYVIPMEGDAQPNIGAAYDMQEFLLRNGVLLSQLTQDVTVGRTTYKRGSVVVDMHQAKRNVANGALYDGVVITGWTDLYSEPITAFGKMRGFACDAIDVAGAIPAAALAPLTKAQRALTQFSGVQDKQVIVDNDSVEAIALANAALKDGVDVGLVTEGEYMDDFILSYSDFSKYASRFIVKATGVAETTTSNSLKPVRVYVPGNAGDFSLKSDGTPYGVKNFPNYGNTNYNFDVYALVEQMGFTVVDSPQRADIIVGNRAPDAAALALIRAGKPYLGYGTGVLSTVKDELLGEYGFDYESTNSIQDALYYVSYPTASSLTTAGYARRGDNIVYSYGGNTITGVPSGAKVLMKATNDYPLEGFMIEENLRTYLGSTQAISYERNGLNVTVFANSLTNKAHQQDDYQFIANTIFAKTMQQAYPGGYTPGFNAALWDSPYADVTSPNWFYGDVGYVVTNGLMYGETTTRFRPDNELTRAMLVAIIHRAAGSPSMQAVDYAPAGAEGAGGAGDGGGDGSGGGESGGTDGGTDAAAVGTFSDVPADEYYYEAVEWAAWQGIVQGTGTGAFNPNDPITRQDLAVILLRFSNAQNQPFAVPLLYVMFADESQIADYAKSAMQTLYNAKIINGSPGNLVEPLEHATRAETAAMLHRLLEKWYA